MRVYIFAKTKTNIGNIPLRHWKTIEISKIVGFQSLNYTSKPKGYLLQTTKLWEKLTVLNRRKKKRRSPKEEVNVLSLNRVKFVKMTIYYSLWLSYFLVFYFTLGYIYKLEFKLLSIFCIKFCVRVLVEWNVRTFFLRWLKFLINNEITN